MQKKNVYAEVTGRICFFVTGHSVWFQLPRATHVPSAAGGAVCRTWDPPWYHRRRAAAGASLCCGGRCSHRAEDGDCLEAAEEPPELIPGGKERKDTHSEPTKDHGLNNGISCAATVEELIWSSQGETLTKYVTLEEQTGNASQLLHTASAQANASKDYQHQTRLKMSASLLVSGV